MRNGLCQVLSTEHLKNYAEIISSEVDKEPDSRLLQLFINCEIIYKKEASPLLSTKGWQRERLQLVFFTSVLPTHRRGAGRGRIARAGRPRRSSRRDCLSSRHGGLPTGWRRRGAIRSLRGWTGWKASNMVSSYRLRLWGSTSVLFHDYFLAVDHVDAGLHAVDAGLACLQAVGGHELSAEREHLDGGGFSGLDGDGAVAGGDGHCAAGRATADVADAGGHLVDQAGVVDHGHALHAGGHGLGGDDVGAEGRQVELLVALQLAGAPVEVGGEVPLRFADGLSLSGVGAVEHVVGAAEERVGGEDAVGRHGAWGLVEEGVGHADAEARREGGHMVGLVGEDDVVGDGLGDPCIDLVALDGALLHDAVLAEHAGGGDGGEGDVLVGLVRRDHGVALSVEADVEGQHDGGLLHLRLAVGSLAGVLRHTGGGGEVVGREEGLLVLQADVAERDVAAGGLSGDGVLHGTGEAHGHEVEAVVGGLRLEVVPRIDGVVLHGDGVELAHVDVEHRAVGIV